MAVATKIIRGVAHGLKGKRSADRGMRNIERDTTVRRFIRESDQLRRGAGRRRQRVSNTDEEEAVARQIRGHRQGPIKQSGAELRVRLGKTDEEKPSLAAILAITGLLSAIIAFLGILSLLFNFIGKAGVLGINVDFILWLIGSVQEFFGQEAIPQLGGIATALWVISLACVFIGYVGIPLFLFLMRSTTIDLMGSYGGPLFVLMVCFALDMAPFTQIFPWMMVWAYVLSQSISSGEVNRP